MPIDRFRLDDRVAVITGASRGIGAACARELAAAGADVVLTSRTAEALEEVAAEVRDLGRRAVVVPGDVNDLDHLSAVVDAAVDALGAHRRGGQQRRGHHAPAVPGHDAGLPGGGPSTST